MSDMSSPVRSVCFYLPQYHPIPENDHWWGKGFTEWTNVAKAKPWFPGHHQPHLPADLGFYDLRVPEVREAQAALAAEYGIYGFCYYHYWFGGHRLLERPFQEVLASGRPDFPFCLCWANENWTRRWDGMEHEILIRQQHSDQDDVNFIRDIIPAFKDRRYIRVNGKPLLIVYRTTLLPNPARTAAIWREEVKASGLEDLYLCRAETFTAYGDHVDPVTIGFDSALEFPPHAIKSRSIRHSTIPAESEFAGDVFDYEQVVLGSLMRSRSPYKLFRGVIPGWDNTPRKPKTGYVFTNSSPELYEEWLADCVRWTRRQHKGDERLVFINAWNEWGEGCHLEPDTRYGHRYLEATRSAIHAEDNLLQALQSRPIVFEGRIDPESVVDDFSSYVSGVFRVNMVLNQRLRQRETELQLITGRKELSPDLLSDDVSLSVLLGHYLRLDKPRFRRTRRVIYWTLRGLWRAARLTIGRLRRLRFLRPIKSRETSTKTA